MRKPKQQAVVGKSGTKGGHHRNKSPGGSSPYILDRQLVPRVEVYAKSNTLADVDAVVASLRHSYKEYQRKPMAAFKQMVVKAITVVEAKAQPAAEESGEGSSGSESGSSDSSSEGSSGSGDDEDDSNAMSDSDGGSEAAAPKDRGGVNDMMRSMYASRQPPAEAGEEGTQKAGSSKQSPDSPPRQPFAPPAEIAAAAARALAAHKASMKAKSGSAAANASSSAPDAAGTQDPGAAKESVPGAAGQDPAGLPVAATPAPAQAGKPNSRSADDAGLPQDARPVSTAKRARRAAGGAGQGGGGGGGRSLAGGQRGSSSSAVVAARPVMYADLGGVEDVLADIRELIEYPLKHPEVYSWLGVEPPRGVLLHGPPGCGKTALANAIANECGVPFLRVSAPEIVSGMSGESEAKLRSLFQEAADLAPCIIFIDEIDAIAPKRETAQREMERRIVAQMLTCMDDLSAPAAAASDPAAAEPTDAKQTLDPADPDAATRPKRQPRPHVVVIGATNRPDALDPALRRAGRFDREIALGIPSEAARAKIIQVITKGLRLEGNFDFRHIAKRTPGFVGADLMALVKEAAALAVTRVFSELNAKEAAAQAELTSKLAAAATPDAAQPQGEAADGNAAAAGIGTGQQVVVAPRFGAGPLGPEELKDLSISMSDFNVAIGKVQPSVRREGFTTTPDVSWEDVGSLDEVREELSFSITQPIMHPEHFEALGMETATGVLLYGPPGCGKTLVAKAVANESGANFISIKGPELLNKYVGESERAVRQLFSRARAAQPCVLFFDEMDALAPRRGTDNNQAAERLVNQLLTEMDGVQGRQGVYVVAATNRPDMIDPALLRPGRLDKVLYVPLPPPDGRAAILKALTRRTPLAPGLDVAAIGASEQCNGFSGADMAALVREASVLALKSSMQAGVAGAAGQLPAAPQGGVRVEAHHFAAALQRISPSVSKKDARTYEALRRSLRGNLRSRLEPVAEQPPSEAGAAAGGGEVPAGHHDRDDAAGREGDADGPVPMLA